MNVALKQAKFNCLLIVALNRAGIPGRSQAATGFPATIAELNGKISLQTGNQTATTHLAETRNSAWSGA